MINVGVVSYSSDKFNEINAKALLAISLDIVEDAMGGEKFALVSGFSDIGIPGLAYRMAKTRGWKTVGLSAAEVKEYDCYDVDEEIIEGEKFGDESEKFIEYIDCLVRIGGGPQSFKEVEMAEDAGMPVFEFDLPESD